MKVVPTVLAGVPTRLAALPVGNGSGQMWHSVLLHALLKTDLTVSGAYQGSGWVRWQVDEVNMRFLFLLFIIVPIIEITLLIQVGALIGAWYTVGLVLLSAFIGVNMLRRQSLSTLMRAQQRMNQGEIPGQEMAEGIVIAVGGALLVTPGFVTDIIGFSCLIPQSRRAAVKAVSSRFTVISAQQGFGGPFAGGGFGADPFSQEPFGEGAFKGETFDHEPGHHASESAASVHDSAKHSGSAGRGASVRSMQPRGDQGGVLEGEYQRKD
ncbi:MAG: FxsA family protein [Marinobacterium sp.]|nr:FxsA family protein [Marinobacterium sp.]